jgi:hypothetical protein
MYTKSNIILIIRLPVNFNYLRIYYSYEYVTGVSYYTLYLVKVQTVLEYFKQLLHDSQSDLWCHSAQLTSREVNCAECTPTDREDVQAESHGV